MRHNPNCVADLAATAAKYSVRPVISEGRSNICYGDFVRKASRLAAELYPLIRSGRIGILGSRSATAYIGIAAAAWAGAAYVPLNLKWPAERLIRLMRELQLDAIIVDDNGERCLTAEVVAHAPKSIFFARDVERIGSVDQPDRVVLAEPVQRKETDTAYIVFTSGTTGEPKGVVVSCGSLKRYLDHTETWTGLQPDDRIAEAHDVTFDLSVHNMFLAWRAGASLHLMTALDMMAPQAFIRSRSITCWMSVPTIVNNMRRNGALRPDVFPSLRLSIFCGEPLAMTTVSDWAEAAPNSVIENIYGPTECTVVCTRQRLTQPPVVTPERQILSIGEPYENFDVVIRDSGGNPLGDNLVGEISIASDQLSDGYFNRPEQTAEKFRMVNGRRWYFTGDLGYRDPDGRYHHMGRADNQIKLKGNRVELEEVDMHLRKACNTDLACVVAWPTVEGSVQGLVGYSTNTALTEKQVRSAMMKSIPEYMVPARIVIRENLPRNANDKIDRNALAAELDRESDGSAITAPPIAPELDADKVKTEA